MEEEVVKVKKTRTRRPKNLPLFYKTDSVPEPEYKLSTFEPQHVESEGADISDLVMCPYTKYIPISYLQFSSIGVPSYMDKLHLKARLEKKYPILVQKSAQGLDIFRDVPPMITKMLNYGCSMGSEAQIGNEQYYQTLAHLEQYLLMDQRIAWYYQRYTSNIYGAVDGFRQGKIKKCGFRTYHATVGFFSATTCIADSMHEPHIMAVTLPENYLNHKATTLINKGIDMSKVIILVNRELDLPGISPDIPRAFKALYQKHLEPIIKNTSAKIWKVPLAYIKHNCFLQQFNIKSKKIGEKKAEMEDFLLRYYHRPEKWGEEDRPVQVDSSRVSDTWSTYQPAFSDEALAERINDLELEVS